MISNRDLWFPDYVWSGTLENIDNFAIKKYCQEKINNKSDLFKDDRPYNVADLDPEENNALLSLTETITMCVHKVCAEVGIMPLELQNIWVNENLPGAHAETHTHIHHAGLPGAIFSGVYYVEADATIDQGDIVFERRDTSAQHLPEHFKFTRTSFNSTEARYSSTTNDLYLFSAWLPHRITKNNSNTNRYSISFNYGVK